MADFASLFTNFEKQKQKKTKKKSSICFIRYLKQILTMRFFKAILVVAAIIQLYVDVYLNFCWISNQIPKFFLETET